MNQTEILQVAAQHSIPPSILFALTMVTPPGQAPLVTPQDLETAASKLEQVFARSGTWEQALSAYSGGDPAAATSPTSSVGGTVQAILGIAGSRPTYGMDGFTPADKSRFGGMGRAFQLAMQKLVPLGGVVTPEHVAQFKEVSARASATGSSGSTAGGIGRGLSMDNSKLPFQKFDANPFDPQAMRNESENFNYSWRGNHEQGNDYGMNQGSAISAPMAGKVHLVDMGQAGTGLTAYIKMDNGWTIGIGHLHNASVKEGDVVTAGQMIGGSGGMPGDPHSGNTSGPHVEFQVIAPDGQFHDPQMLLERTTGVQGQMGATVMGGGRGESPATDAETATYNRTQVPNQIKHGGDEVNPEHEDPAAVAVFAQQLKNMQATPEHFMQLFPYVAKLYGRLLGKQPTLDDFAQHVGQTPTDALKSIRDMPHSMFPEHSAGAMLDMANTASLHSIGIVGRMPWPSEVSRMLAAGMKHNDVQKFYGDEQARQSPQQIPNAQGPGMSAQPAPKDDAAGTNVVPLRQGGPR